LYFLEPDPLPTSDLGNGRCFNMCRAYV